MKATSKRYTHTIQTCYILFSNWLSEECSGVEGGIVWEEGYLHKKTTRRSGAHYIFNQTIRLYAFFYFFNFFLLFFFLLPHL